MPDDIIKELWQIKDSIARRHEYNIDALVTHLQAKERVRGHRVVELRGTTEATEQGVPDISNNADVDGQV